MSVEHPKTTPGQRPAHVKAPSYLTPSPPLPAPQPVVAAEEHGGRNGLDPVRYGDWELKGIAVDF
ncbi:DUF1674 domain-containing protein [Aquisediminimonas sediminicola]|uniref:DUF1674 domain-containing protein n=1 Tax=Alteraquisediminimonas sediminicola TaxID=2676787 RepID=UPI001C8D12F7|nr:DUF1674 domain-containing protein [Aquisediminimonas sediminicola]